MEDGLLGECECGRWPVRGRGRGGGGDDAGDVSSTLCQAGELDLTGFKEISWLRDMCVCVETVPEARMAGLGGLAVDLVSGGGGDELEVVVFEVWDYQLGPDW